MLYKIYCVYSERFINVFLITYAMMTKSVVRAFSFNPSYIEKIKMASDKLGISQSELIRRAIDDYLLKYGLLLDIQKIKDSGGG